MNYKELAEQALDYIVEQRRWCHQNPELSLEEVQTTEHIAAELQQGMSQEQIQEMFFSEYELIGYVNLYAGQTLFEIRLLRILPVKRDFLSFMRTMKPCRII